MKDIIIFCLIFFLIYQSIKLNKLHEEIISSYRSNNNSTNNLNIFENNPEIFNKLENVEENINIILTRFDEYNSKMNLIEEKKQKQIEELKIIIQNRTKDLNDLYFSDKNEFEKNIEDKLGIKKYVK